MFKFKRYTKLIAIVLATLFLISVIPFSVLAVGAFPTGILEGIEVAYFHNSYTGEYLYNSNGTPFITSGTIANLGDSIRWKITNVGDSIYTLQSMSDQSLYLTGSSINDVYELGVYLQPLTESTIPDHYKWYIYYDSGGVIIQNIHTNKYLFPRSDELITVISLGTYGTSTYQKKVWCFSDVTYYGDNSTYEMQELPAGYKFKTFHLFAGETNDPRLLDEYDNVMRGHASDFNFTGFDTNYVTFDKMTGNFTASSSTALYSTSVTATHKLTGRTTTFSLVINPNVAMVGVPSPGHDHTSSLNLIRPYFINNGYNAATLYSGDVDFSEIRSYLNNDTNRIFVSRSHGRALYNSSGTLIGTSIALNTDGSDEFYSGHFSGLELSNMNLILFIGCETGAGGENGPNLLTAAVARGAETAIGFANEIDCYDANEWTKDFFDLLSSNTVSVKYACTFLSDNDYQSTAMVDFVICGYKYARIT